MNIVRLHLRMGNDDAEPAMRKAIEIAPDSVAARKLLVNWYLEQDRIEYEAPVLDLVSEIQALAPEDKDGWLLEGMALVSYRRMFGLAVLARQRVADDPTETAWLPLLAQAEAANGRIDSSLPHWRAHTTGLPESERDLFDNLEWVGRSTDRKMLEAVPEGREGSLRRFWREQEAPGLFRGKGARVEHYRRVWYARQYFGRKQFPWDKRGDVYVRCGEPDYCSRSGHANPLPSPAVELVKERIFGEIGGIAPESNPSEAFDQDGFFAPSEHTQGGVLDVVGPVYPIVYPPAPIGAGISLRALAALARHHSGRRMVTLPGEVPFVYTHPYGLEHLDFYYDHASF